VHPSIDWTPKARAVLSAASVLFYDQGIHAVGVDAIAERAGVTKKTLYDRFGSKDRLVVEYLRERDRQWREFLQERLTAAEPGADRVAAVFDAAAQWAAEHGRKGCAMVNAHAEISDPAHPAYAVIVEQKRWMLGLLTGLVAACGVADPRPVAAQLLLLHEGAVVSAPLPLVDDAFASAAAAAAHLLEQAGGTTQSRRPHSRRAHSR
jgi:AcrR family transcriptional regulator